MEEKRNKIMQILSGPGASDVVISKLNALDPNWSEVLNSEAPAPSIALGVKKKTISPPIPVVAESAKSPRVKKPRPSGQEDSFAPERKGKAPVRSIRVLDGLATRLNAAIDPEDFDRVRNSSCKQYYNCLDAVAAKSWPSFSCVNCPRFKRQDRGSP